MTLAEVATYEHTLERVIPTSNESANRTTKVINARYNLFTG